MTQNYRFEEKKPTIESRLESQLPKQDYLTEKKILYEKLSSESKWLVNIILNTPTEFKEIVDGSGRITKHSVLKLLQKIWPTYTINYCLKELKKWVSSF